MADPNGVFLKKQWFIKSNNGKIEDFYDIDVKKVSDFLSPADWGMLSDTRCWLNARDRFLDKARTDKCSRERRKELKLLVRSSRSLRRK